MKLGVDKIHEWANKMGMGVKTGIDLPGEAQGLIPNPAWKAALNEGKPLWEQKWYPGETVNLSIGQGSANTTPLQNALMMAVITNGGFRVQPHLNRDLKLPPPERILSEATIKTVTDGMRLCVEKGPPAPTGTGNRAHIPGVQILGKTGSAQVMALKHHEQFENEEDIPYEFRDHAWFVAGVLNRDPKISMCILVEHGHHGSSAASPLAKEIITHFYQLEVEDSELLARAGEE